MASVSYTNLGESIRQAAKMLNQIGAMLPMMIGMAGAQADPEALKPVQEVVGLLPSVSRIVAKFDFLEAKMAVTQGGPEPGTFLTRTVTVVRPVAAPTRNLDNGGCGAERGESEYSALHVCTDGRPRWSPALRRLLPGLPPVHRIVKCSNPDYSP